MTTINTRRVRAWMVLQGLTQDDVAREAGFCQPFVSKYVLGQRGSAKLTRYFLGKGCPAKYLSAREVEKAQREEEA